MMDRELATRPQVLVGWSTVDMTHGCVLRLESAQSKVDLRQGAIEEQSLVLTVNQLRLLGEYLVKLADQREGKAPRKQRWWSL